MNEVGAEARLESADPVIDAQHPWPMRMRWSRLAPTVVVGLGLTSCSVGAPTAPGATGVRGSHLRDLRSPAGALAAPSNGSKLLPSTVQGPSTFFDASWDRDFITMSARSGR